MRSTLLAWSSLCALFLALTLVSASPSGLVARQATTIRCSATKPCASGTSRYCSSTGYCTAQVKDGVACPSNAACLNGLCQTTGLCASTNLANAKKCSLDTQCTSGYCNTTITAQPLCAAKVKDGVKCDKNSACINSLCQSNGLCTSTNLANASKCSADSQCTSGNCDLTLSTPICAAKVKDGVKCSKNTNCINSLCQSNNLCSSTNLANASKCSLDSQCSSGFCDTSLATPLCAAKAVDGKTCSKASSCLSGLCNKTCQSNPATKTSTVKTSSSTVKASSSTAKISSTSTATVSSSTAKVSSSSTASTSTHSSTSSSSIASTSAVSTSTASSSTQSTSTASTSTSSVQTSTSSTSTADPGPTYLPAGPGDACTPQGGCLGNGAYVCNKGTCQAAGGHLQPCRSDKSCPGDSKLYCADADNVCHFRTACSPECDPTKQGCLSYVITMPGMSYGATQCVDTDGSVGKTCIGDGQCKDDTLQCEASSNTCKLTAAALAAATSTAAPAPKPTTCSPVCDSATQNCQTFSVNGDNSYACVPAGARGQSCRSDGTCISAADQCNQVSKMCERLPQTTCEPGCAANQVCQVITGSFLCINAGAIGQPPLSSGSCNAGLAPNAATGLCDMIQLGGSCSADSQCTGSLRCTSGICSLTGSAGLACTRQGTCDSSSYCYNTTSTCMPFGNVGDACPGGIDSQCSSGLSCLSKVCKKAGAWQSPCFANKTCLDSSLTCDFSTSICQYASPQASGTSCLQESDCVSGTRCIASSTDSASSTKTCQPAGLAGQLCNASGNCTDTSICLSGLCRAVAAINGTCSDLVPCASGSLCSNVTVQTGVTMSTGSIVTTNGNQRRMNTMNLGTLPLGSWNPLWYHPRGQGADDLPDVTTTTTTAVPDTTTVQQCVRAGYQGDVCFANNTCSLDHGAQCNTTTNRCDKVYVPINATCTADDTNDPLGNVTCAEGLRCSTTTAIKQIGSSYGFVNVSTCTAAGGYNQKCLVNNTDSSFYCSAGYACSAQNAKVGKCQKGVGMSCEKDTECGGTSSCISGVCTAVGDLGQACIGNSSCQAGLSCNTTTSRGVCYTRDTTLCEDFSTYNLTKLCPNCGDVCTLGTDLVTVTCSFTSSATPYDFTVPRGITNITVYATSGAGGNSTVYAANWTAVDPAILANYSSTNASGSSTSTIGTGATSTATVPGSTSTAVPPVSQYPALTFVNSTAYIKGTNITVPMIKQSSMFGGFGATFSSWAIFKGNATYRIFAGGAGLNAVPGVQGGGAGFYDSATNSSSGAGGGRTQILLADDSSNFLCLGGGGGAGYLAGGGNAGFNGNGTDGFGITGASNSTSGGDASKAGLGAGGGGCMGGTAAFSLGAGGGGGASNPLDKVTSAGVFVYGNRTAALPRMAGSVGLTFSCPK